MKKIILSLIAIFAMTTVSLAQDQAQNGQQRRQRMDQTEMIKRRTDRLVETLKLNEEQAKKVQELNEKYFKNMGQRNGQQQGQRNENAGEQQNTQRNENAQRPQGQRFGFNMNEYNEDLKKILTEEQYKAYEADAERMRNNFRRQGFGNGNGRQRGGFGGQRRDQQQ